MGAAGAGGPDNKLYTWGSGSNGALGLGNTTSYSSPKQVGALNDWSIVKGSAFRNRFHAIKTDGTLWSWGDGTNGALGLGSITSYSSPKQVGALTNWSKISNGRFFAVAIKTNNTIWSWGLNSTYGQLGLGNTTDYSSPKQIGALTNWSQVSCGDDHAAAIKTDGTLWTWGCNYNGQLGIGTSGSAAHKSSPVQVGALTTWSKIAAGSNFCAGITSDGKLWTWGANFNGQLGTNNLTYRSSPTQVGALTTWSNVFTAYRTCFAVKTDGTLWGWGLNNTGQIGDGTLTAKSSPVQIGALTNWSVISPATSFVIALKTDKTIWGWGNGSNGRLGDGTVVSKSSPVQIGSLSNWMTIGTCNSAGSAISE